MALYLLFHELLLFEIQQKYILRVLLQIVERIETLMIVLLDLTGASGAWALSVGGHLTSSSTRPKVLHISLVNDI